MRIIAVDFDGTLCESKWPEIGEPHIYIIQEVKKTQQEGAKLILWTCREGERLREAVEWCDGYDLHFDAVNDNIQESKDLYGDNPRNISATEYWDDRAVIVTGFTRPGIFLHREYDKDGRFLQQHVIASNPKRNNLPIRIRVKEWLKKWHSA